MAYASLTNSIPGRASNIVDTTTDRQRRIISVRPTLYLTPEAKYFQTAQTGEIQRWHDATGLGYFRPGGAVPPAVVDEGDGLRSINFVGNAGQALVDALSLDRISASGSPCTIVTLVRQASGAGNFGGGVMGNRTPYGSDMLAYYIDGSGGTASLQTQFGTPGKELYSTVAINNNSWHLVILTWKGSAVGAQVIQDGAGQIVVSNTLTLSAHAAARKVVVGDYGPIGTHPIKGKLAALAILPVYVGNGENSELLADVTAEFQAFRTSLNA